MQLKDSVCEFCPKNQFSDGTGACQECGVSTAPEIGVVYKWWSNLPANSNVTSSCLSMNGEFLGCFFGGGGLGVGVED